MEATFLAKRTLFNIPKFLPQSPPGIQSTRRVTRACLSTAYERAEGSNAVVEEEGSSDITDAPRDYIRDGTKPNGFHRRRQAAGQQDKLRGG
ncbi:hypothetical protein QUC31_002127 [Theobroma cacao]